MNRENIISDYILQKTVDDILRKRGLKIQETNRIEVSLDDAIAELESLMKTMRYRKLISLLLIKVLG